MTNTQTQEDLNSNAKEGVAPTEAESQYKALTDKIAKEEEILDKASFTRSKLEDEIIAMKAEVKSLKGELDTAKEQSFNEEEIISKQDVLETVNSVFSKREQEEAAKETRNLLTGIEDKYQKEVIESEMAKLNPALSPRDRFEIARRNADFMVKAQSNNPKVETEGQKFTHSTSFTGADEDTTDPIIADLKSRIGLN